MKPPPFDYHAARSVSEALELLGRYAEDARLLAGGQSLVPMLNFRLATPRVLIDLNRVGELAYIREENGWLRLGAMTRQRAIEFSPLVKERIPLLVEALGYVGHLPTRTRGTIGGSVAHADPSAECPALLCALGGELVIRGAGGERVVGAADFFQDFFTTALQPGELLVEVRLPVMPARSGWAFEEFARRHGDFAIVEVAAQVTLDERGGCRAARVAAAGVGATPLRLRAVEQIVERGGGAGAVVAQAAARAAELVDPAGDHHASADYRRHLTEVLTRRALSRAFAGVERSK
ncbi:MAG: xanthine dehydrogenase family protein subunit M [Deltaproteobacteria bacterium]|jgi:CO/xanthine dehydrogenase FAD-binding subunit|nr:xanthine dehydrogenase family protein subunit M [Deltaproteobacteria bacterium]